MPTPDVIRAFMAQSSASGARSNVLHPLAWLSGLLIVGLGLSSYRDAPTWMLVVLIVLLGVTVFLFLAGFIYFALRNPDQLRSERYTLSKLALEKNLMGDNVSGLMEVDEAKSVKRGRSLPPPEVDGAP